MSVEGYDTRVPTVAHHKCTDNRGNSAISRSVGRFSCGEEGRWQGSARTRQGDTREKASSKLCDEPPWGGSAGDSAAVVASGQGGGGGG